MNFRQIYHNMSSQKYALLGCGSCCCNTYQKIKKTDFLCKKRFFIQIEIIRKSVAYLHTRFNVNLKAFCDDSHFSYNILIFRIFW